MGRRRAPTRPETLERATDELIEVLERLTAQGWDPYPLGDTDRIGPLWYGDLAVVLGGEVAVTWNPATHCWEPWSLEWDGMDPDEEERHGRVG